MPKIKDIKPYIYAILNNFKKANNIKNIYIWGSYARNINKPNYRVKDIDVLIKTNFNSGDLLSVDNNIIAEICSNNYLENQGYDPKTVKFSKNFLKLSKYNVDCWVTSSDRKLIHWGPIIANKEEAEQYATKITGDSCKKINYSSENIRKNWYNTYCHYIDNKYFQGMPTGWYKIDSVKIKDLTLNSIKI
jgi:predicted nucleotidyltransferase